MSFVPVNVKVKLPKELAVVVANGVVLPTMYKSTVAPAVVVPVSSGVRVFVYPGVLVTKVNVGVVGAEGGVGGVRPGTLSVNESVTVLLMAPASSVVYDLDGLQAVRGERRPR